MWRNYLILLTCCQDCSAALVTICAGFLSCCATRLFLDAAALVVGLDPIVCLHLANRCSSKWTQFSEPLPCIVSGDKDLNPRKQTMGHLMTHCVGNIICGICTVSATVVT